MSPLRQAIALLEVARDLIETEARFRPPDTGDRQDLEDAAEDLGPILHCLNSFANPAEDAT